jgi:hypothetical protein
MEKQSGPLTPRDGGAVDDVLERLEDEPAVDEEAEVALDGRLPLGDGRRLRLLLPLPRLVLGVQLHGDRPHLLHERLPPFLPARRGSHLRRRRRRDQPRLRGRHHPGHGPGRDGERQAVPPPGGDSGGGREQGEGAGGRERCRGGRHGRGVRLRLIARAGQPLPACFRAGEAKAPVTSDSDARGGTGAVAVEWERA